MGNSVQSEPVIRFQDFQVNLVTGELWKAGIRLKLQDQPFKILAALLQRPGQIVTRDELHKLIWPQESFGDFDHAISLAVNKLRTALGDSADVPHLIETLPRRGYRFIGPLTPPESVAIPSAKDQVIDPGSLQLGGQNEIQLSTKVAWWSAKPIRVSPLVVAVLVGVLIAINVTNLRRRFSNIRMAPRGDVSIAVLPFADLSPQRDQEYFSDGLAEELLDSLAKIPGLKVAARTSSFQYKSKSEDVRVVGQKLNVASVLEGSVRKQGQRVRVSVQLIQTSDGFHLWSQTYDRDLTDIFSVQEDIARSVANSLSVPLLAGKVPSARPTSFDAYSAYLQGRYYQARFDVESMKKALDFYEQSVKLDPEYAPGWAGLSLVHGILADGYGISDGGYRNRRNEAERALAIDPSLADAHVALAKIQHAEDWDWKAAQASLHQALALAPLDIDALQESAYLAATLNQFDEALRLDQMVVELDPLGAPPFEYICFEAWWAGRLDESESAGRKALELAPEMPQVHSFLSRVFLARSRPNEALVEAEQEPFGAFHLQSLALAYHALGRKEESDRCLRELISKFREDNAFQIAEVYAFRGELDAAAEWLSRSYTQRDPGLMQMKGDPLLKNLEHDQRYVTLLNRMHLLD